MSVLPSGCVARERVLQAAPHPLAEHSEVCAGVAVQYSTIQYSIVQWLRAGEGAVHGRPGRHLRARAAGGAGVGRPHHR